VRVDDVLMGTVPTLFFLMVGLVVHWGSRTSRDANFAKFDVCVSVTINSTTFCSDESELVGLIALHTFTADNWEFSD